MGKNRYGSLQQPIAATVTIDVDGRAEAKEGDMSVKARRIFRPQNIAAILGMGVLSVASFGLVLGTLPLGVELVAAALGLSVGATAVLNRAA